MKARKMTPEERAKFMEGIGLFCGLVSKTLLEASGHDVNYKINGLDISEIKILSAPELKDLLALAVAEERFEDAAKLKKLIEDGKR